MENTRKSGTFDRTVFSNLMRSIGEPERHILRVLPYGEGIQGIEIIKRVEKLLEGESSPYETVDPSTEHYALLRLEKVSLVEKIGLRGVEVPGVRGSTRLAERMTYGLSEIGAGIIADADFRASLAAVHH